MILIVKEIIVISFSIYCRVGNLILTALAIRRVTLRNLQLALAQDVLTLAWASGRVLIFISVDSKSCSLLRYLVLGFHIAGKSTQNKGTQRKNSERKKTSSTFFFSFDISSFDISLVLLSPLEQAIQRWFQAKRCSFCTSILLGSFSFFFRLIFVIPVRWDSR